MKQFSLKSEPTENVLGKQSLKIKYLQKQLVRLQEYVKDVEDAAKLNKEALKIALNINDNENDQIKLGNNSSLSKEFPNYYKNTSFSQFSFSTYASYEKKITNQLFEENKKLTASINKIREERNFAESRVFYFFKMKNFFYFL